MPVKFWISAVVSTAIVAWAADTRLADAAEHNDVPAVQSLIAEKADVNAPQGDGTTALHWAAFNDNLQMARMLVAAGANVKATTRDGAITPLFMAAKNGDAKMIELLLQYGADANSTDERGTTALMTAAASGSADAVRVLIEHGADVNAKEGAHGQTALMFAAALNRADAIKALLDAHADPDVTTRAVKVVVPRTPRFQDKPAADAKPASADANADKSALDALAAGMGLKSAEYNPGTDSNLRAMVAKLSTKIDEIEKRLPGEKSKPGQDSNGGMYGIIRERGTSDMGGMTALLFAARDGQMDAARALLQGGADINQVSVSEKTSPLVLAVMNGHYDLAKFLVDWGADPNLQNEQGLTALYATIDVQWAPRGWFPSPEVGQEKISYLDLMKALLADGANPDARITKKLWFRSFGDHSWVDTAGATAFWRAASSTDVAAMKLLVAGGANPDIATFGGVTPLEAACGVGWAYHNSMNAPDYTWMDAAKYLVRLGADVNHVDDRGYTPVHGAAYIGNNELIQFLIDHGADVKAVAKDKNTVADMANGPTRFGIPHAETVAFLEKLGSANSHNCRSDQCLVAPKEDKKKPTGN